MLATVKTFKVEGTQAVPVTVECQVAESGIGIHLVGLADSVVKESLLRTVTALQANGYHIPGRKMVINLAPADLVKSGSGYDLPIALAIIAASGQEPFSSEVMNNLLFIGELGLDGSVRDIPGGFLGLELAEKTGKTVAMPMDTALREGYKLADKAAVVTSLKEAVALCKGADMKDFLLSGKPYLAARLKDEQADIPDFAEIAGNEGAKRAMEIAAAGGHNVILIGPPGSAKSSLAKAMVGILPPMDMQEARDVARVYSPSRRSFPRVRPFRAPHISASLSAFFGGGAGDSILPGEVSLANNGILFLDEFAELPKAVKEALRGPLEDKSVTISRLRAKVTYPAAFQLVAATNPCPCGYYGEGDRCTCTQGQRMAYLSHLSGPVMDRIDIQAWTHPATNAEICNVNRTSSEEIARRVKAARRIQAERFAGEGIRLNAEMPAERALRACGLTEDDENFVEDVFVKMSMSARAFVRCLRIARTIADLDGSERVERRHLAEAVSFRFLDRNI